MTTQKPKTIMRPIKIGATVFEVDFVESLRDGDRRLDGHIRYGDTKILIDAYISGMRARAVIMHEIIHAIADSYVIDLGEQEIERLANGIAAMLVDNPHIVDLYDIPRLGPFERWAEANL